MKNFILLFVPLFNLGNAKTKNNIFLKIAFSWFLLFCGIASQIEHAREHNRIYTENKFWKLYTDWQNSLAMHFYRLV